MDREGRIGREEREDREKELTDGWLYGQQMEGRIDKG